MKEILRTFLFFGVIVLAGCFDKEEITKSSLTNVTISAAELKQPIRFADKALPSYVKSTSGLDAPEAFGRWSTKKLVIIEFSAPLPNRVNLEIVAAAFGPNIGGQARVFVGAEARTFVVNTDTTAAATNRMSFENTGGDSFLVIEVPSPISPAELGKGQDLRKLGLAMISLQIAPK
jgi:phosphoglycerol transferase